jgi:hypothetical protein
MEKPARAGKIANLIAGKVIWAKASLTEFHPQAIHEQAAWKRNLVILKLGRLVCRL